MSVRIGRPPHDHNPMPVPRRHPRAAAMIESRVPLVGTRRPAQMNVMHAPRIDGDTTGPSAQASVGAVIVGTGDVDRAVERMQRDAT